MPPHLTSAIILTRCSRSYWVTEKSDGVRVLLIVLTNLDTSEQIVFIVRLWCFLNPFCSSYCCRSTGTIRTEKSLASSFHITSTQNDLFGAPWSMRNSSLTSTLVQSMYVVFFNLFSGFRTRNRCCGQETLRLLCFDCLVVDNQNVMSKTLDKRYWVGRVPLGQNVLNMGCLQRLKEYFSKPYAKMLRDHPHMVESQPFE